MIKQCQVHAGIAMSAARRMLCMAAFCGMTGLSLAGCSAEPAKSQQDAGLNATENLQAAADKALREAEAALANSSSTEVAETDTGWSYDDSEDEMTGKLIQSACVVSENEVNLPWPYGATRGRLCLRNHPQFGRGAYVSLVGEGQILCPSYDGCELAVRFNGAEPESFSASAPDDHSSDMVFFSDYERPRLEAAVARSNVTRVQLEFYQAGSQAFRFNTSGFKWASAAKPTNSDESAAKEGTGGE